ncbi:hypothetical protein MVEG_10988 [Podila verticillata NRRL 6337]|uniref:Uncharacterized protein n=1 Tax=Podila verticillata NRRL 6337 TaxID=1069443 RepID=A0A086TLX3_9FUNG|nr:hypothetical protein MVEG_10988 [Podila verticillata NRRL 6337]
MALSSATLPLEQDAQHEPWRPFPGCIEDIGVKVERDPYVHVYHKTVVDPEKFQRARRYCSNMLSNGLFDWRGEEYQLRHLPQKDQDTTVTSIPDDDSVMADNRTRNDTASDRDRSFNIGVGINNYTSNAFHHNVSLTESNKEHTNRGSTHNNEPCTPIIVEKNRIESDEEVGETMDEDEDELMIPSKHLANCQKARELLATNKNEKIKTEEAPHAIIHLERSPKLDENTSPPTPTIEIMSEILTWTCSTVSDGPTPGQRPTSPTSPAPFPQFSSPILSPVHNVYSGSQEYLDILFKDMAPSSSPKSLLGSED